MDMDGNLNIVTHNMGALNISYKEDGADGIADTPDDEELFDMFLLSTVLPTYKRRFLYVLSNHAAFLKYFFPQGVSFVYVLDSFRFSYYLHTLDLRIQQA